MHTRRILLAFSLAASAASVALQIIKILTNLLIQIDWNSYQKHYLKAHILILMI